MLSASDGQPGTDIPKMGISTDISSAPLTFLKTFHVEHCPKSNIIKSAAGFGSETQIPGGRNSFRIRPCRILMRPAEFIRQLIQQLRPFLAV